MKQIEIRLVDDNQYNPGADFYVILKNPRGEAALGDPSVARVTIIDDDSKITVNTLQKKCNIRLATCCSNNYVQSLNKFKTH